MSIATPRTLCSILPYTSDVCKTYRAVHLPKRREHGINMATSLDEEASDRSRHRARRVYHPARGNDWSTEGKAAAVGTDYLTASLGQYEGGAPSGAFPVDRYRGHRIRCKAALKSNMANDKGREVWVGNALG